MPRGWLPSRAGVLKYRINARRVHTVAQERNRPDAAGLAALPGSRAGIPNNAPNFSPFGCAHLRDIVTVGPI